MHIYKKVLPAAVALALAACGGGSDTVPDQSEGAVSLDDLGTYARFNPAVSDLPLNTDLLFAAAATSDGTANTGGSNPVSTAIRSLDGFSTNASFDVGFAGGSLDAGSLCTLLDQAMMQCAQPNVFLVPLVTNGDALDLKNVVAPDADALAETAISASVVSLANGDGNTLRITPLNPLLPATKYLVFITNGVKDVDGNPVSPSFQYNLLRTADDATAATFAASLQSIRTAIGGWESLAAAVLTGDPTSQAAKDSIAISFTFTTTDPVAPLLANAASNAAIVQAQRQTFGVDAVSAVQNLGAILMEGVTLNSPQPRNVSVSPAGVDANVLTEGALAEGVVSLYFGSMDLPYYLRTPETTVSGNYKLDSWQADQELGAALLPKVKASLPEEVAETLPEQLPLPDVDKSTFNVTYRYPFAKQASVESVPLQVTLPDPAYEVAPGVTCAAAKPDGLPVAMYVHGIGSDRTSVVALAHSLAKACVATVAIDLPLHGGRAFEEGNAALNFINLGVLTNTRDNLRQSVMDLLNLNASLANIDAELEAGELVGLDTSDVKVVGVSLGGIVGTTYATVNQLAIAADGKLAKDAANPALASKLNPLSGLVVSAAGGQLTQVLINSEALGPSIQAGLAAGGIEAGSSDFEKFLYVAQSTVDSGDPVNFAETLAGAEECDLEKAGAGHYPSILKCAELTVPVLVQQIVGGGVAGDGKDYTADKVVPNGVATAPLAGTTPLARLLAAVQVGPGPGAEDLTTMNALVNLTIGHHASLLRPNEADGVDPVSGELLATGELQTEVVSFVADPSATAVGTAGEGAASNFIQAP
ncbi:MULTISPECIES: Ig-like domain-containing protein [unclassified Alcanivorax]|jgi:Pla-1/cef family extracellular lipase|uniref:Ig-like domain-containing protein n=2 Tax=Alcanivorax TaxID=59753 RepID=UPI000789E6A5|nr:MULTISPECIES: Ig-like domain-containing protein [unclassified Alcanivorax]MBU84782.1 hypothetical protein [Alcanivorax sp.]MEE2602428.1 Ig-like domain-containing protein [Pseudomonadota bacterium]